MCREWVLAFKITSAFKALSIHPDFWWIFSVHWHGAYYFAVRLTFGCKSSPELFDTLSKALCWIMLNTHKLLFLIHFLDNFLIITPLSSLPASGLTALTSVTFIPLSTGPFHVSGVPWCHPQHTCFWPHYQLKILFASAFWSQLFSSPQVAPNVSSSPSYATSTLHSASFPRGRPSYLTCYLSLLPSNPSWPPSPSTVQAVPSSTSGSTSLPTGMGYPFSTQTNWLTLTTSVWSLMLLHLSVLWGFTVENGL